MNLQSRGLAIPPNCVFCGTNPENVWHVFISCPYAREVCSEANLWGVINSLAIDSTDFPHLFLTIAASSFTYVFTKVVMVMWSLWR